MDLTRRLPFRLRTKDIQLALSRGVLFEICYSGAIQGSGGGRRQLFGQAAALIQAAGRNAVCVSSGAVRAMDLRGPYDVANLCTCFSLDPGSAKAAISEQCRKVLAHGAARKTYRGVLKVDMELSSS